MAIRSYVIRLRNELNIPLQKHDAEVCGGDWAGPQPPDRIEPGEAAVFSTESKTPVTGTKGFVRYVANFGEKTTENTNIPPNIVCVAWTNPFVGVTNTKCGVRRDSIDVRDCEIVPNQPAAFDKPPSAQTFKQPFDSTGQATDLEEVLIEMPLAPFFVFANAGIRPHAISHVGVGVPSNSLKECAVRFGLDLSNGVKHLARDPAQGLRFFMGIP